MKCDRSRYKQTAKQTLTVIFFVFNCWSLTELVVSLFLLNFYQPTQYSCSYTLKPNHLYSRNRNRGSISSWRRLFNRNENLRLLLTRYLAIASLRERLIQYCITLTETWRRSIFLLQHSSMSALQGFRVYRNQNNTTTSSWLLGTVLQVIGKNHINDANKNIYIKYVNKIIKLD